MDPKDKIRLGTVTGDVAARLGETLSVTGVSIKDFTKEAVEQHLLRTTSRDGPRRPASQDVSQDVIRIVPDPIIKIYGIEDDNKGFLIPNDPEIPISIDPCPTCGAPCLTCSDGLLPLNKFKNMVTKAVEKRLEEARPGR